MCLFRQKHEKATDIEILPLEKIVEIMYDKNLTFSDEAVDVFYCPDKTKRYVVLKRTCDNNYTFIYEQMIVFDADELRWMKTDSLTSNDVLPAYWSPSNRTVSIFGTLEETLNHIRFEPEYKQYFELGQ